MQNWFEKEKKLSEDYGRNLIFSVYQITNHEEEKSKMIVENSSNIIILSGDLVSGKDSVKDVCEMLRKRISSNGITLHDDHKIKILLDDEVMHDEDLFYASHCILLPCWLDVLITSPEYEAYKTKQMVELLQKRKEEILELKTKLIEKVRKSTKRKLKEIEESDSTLQEGIENASKVLLESITKHHSDLSETTKNIEQVTEPKEKKSNMKELEGILNEESFKKYREILSRGVDSRAMTSEEMKNWNYISKQIIPDEAKADEELKTLLLIKIGAKWYDIEHLTPGLARTVVDGKETYIIERTFEPTRRNIVSVKCVGHWSSSSIEIKPVTFLSITKYGAIPMDSLPTPLPVFEPLVE
jgi:hypothetical protein